MIEVEEDQDVNMKLFNHRKRKRFDGYDQYEHTKNDNNHNKHKRLKLDLIRY